MDKEMLKSYGIDYDKGLKNCMGNEKFYKKILSMFLEDTCFQRAKEAYKCGKAGELFCCIHELKGVSGNTALVELYDTTVQLVEILRKQTEMPDGVDKLLDNVEKAYIRTCEGISLLIGDE